MPKKGEPDRTRQLDPNHVDKPRIQELARTAQRVLEDQGKIPGLPNGSPPIYDGPQAGGVMFNTMPTGQKLTLFTSKATGDTIHISVSPTPKESQVSITNASRERTYLGQAARAEAEAQMRDVEVAARRSARHRPQ